MPENLRLLLCKEHEQSDQDEDDSSEGTESGLTGIAAHPWSRCRCALSSDNAKICNQSPHWLYNWIKFRDFQILSECWSVIQNLHQRLCCFSAAEAVFRWPGLLIFLHLESRRPWLTHHADQRHATRALDPRLTLLSGFVKTLLWAE